MNHTISKTYAAHAFGHNLDLLLDHTNSMFYILREVDAMRENKFGSSRLT